MKKTPVILLLLIGILGSCGQGGSPIASDSSPAASEASNTQNVSDIFFSSENIISPDLHEAQQNSIIKEHGSEKSINEIITTAYPEKDLIEFFVYETLNMNTDIIRANEKFPIECLRQPNSSCIYCVYKTQEGGLYYVFYNSKLKFASYALYVKQQLTQKDFKPLKKGIGIDKVEKIDKGFQIVNSISPDSAKVSLHLVENGFMQITYRANTEDSWDRQEYKIETIKFIPNGEKVLEGYVYSLGQNFTILEQDYFK